jgi:hypothetical protein
MKLLGMCLGAGGLALLALSLLVTMLGASSSPPCLR